MFNGAEQVKISFDQFSSACVILLSFHQWKKNTVTIANFETTTGFAFIYYVRKQNGKSLPAGSLDVLDEKSARNTTKA